MVPAGSDVFTLDEVALATGVPRDVVEAHARAGALRLITGTHFVAGDEVLKAAAQLRCAARHVAGGIVHADREVLSAERRRPPPRHRAPAIVSSAGHLALAAVVLWWAAGPAQTAASVAPAEPVRMVFLLAPGPGGGGGGGGVRKPRPAPRLERAGAQPNRDAVPAAVRERTVTAPEPVPEPPQPTPAVAPPPREEAPREPLPSRAAVAPVVRAEPDDRNRTGVVEAPAPPTDGGAGTNGGAGSGRGTGLGQGQGAGIGPGAGGGTGGGPFRPGSGVEPPRLLREVKAEYTEEARRRGLTGEVVLEIVVLRDGSVGDVRLRKGLGAGLDARAIAAVRQWRFAPARLRGAPVDVQVEVAVEFTLR